jgi:hypothetical protein
MLELMVVVGLHIGDIVVIESQSLVGLVGMCSVGLLVFHDIVDLHSHGLADVDPSILLRYALCHQPFQGLTHLGRIVVAQLIIDNFEKFGSDL